MSIRAFLISHLFHRYLLIFSLISLGHACREPTEEASGIYISTVAPNPATQGAVIEVQGASFGNQPQTIAFEGRSLSVISWTPHSILAQIPMDTAVGNGYLVIQRLGENSKPFAMKVEGEPVNRESNRQFTDYRTSMSDIDWGKDLAIDQSLIDQNLSQYEYELRSNVDNADVVLVPKINRNQQLVLELHLKNQVNPWGITFHFNYDATALKLVNDPAHDPTLNQDLKTMKLVKEVRPGYLLIFSAYPQEMILSLTFDIIQTGDLSFSFPIRGRVFKDENKKSKQLRWGDGILFLKEKGQ
jgi:hypothetical protein